MRPAFFLSSFACLCFKLLFSLLKGYTKQGWAHLWKVPGSLGKGRLCAARTNSFGSEEVGDWAAQTEECELESPRGNLSCWAECFPMFCFRCYLPLGLNYVGWFLFFLKWQCFAPCSPRKIPCSALALQTIIWQWKGYIYIYFLGMKWSVYLSVALRRKISFVCQAICPTFCKLYCRIWATAQDPPPPGSGSKIHLDISQGCLS